MKNIASIKKLDHFSAYHSHCFLFTVFFYIPPSSIVSSLISCLFTFFSHFFSSSFLFNCFSYHFHHSFTRILFIFPLLFLFPFSSLFFNRFSCSFHHPQINHFIIIIFCIQTLHNPSIPHAFIPT